MLFVVELDPAILLQPAEGGGEQGEHEEDEEEATPLRSMLRAIKTNDMPLLQKMVIEEPGLVRQLDERWGGMSGLMGAARIRR